MEKIIDNIAVGVITSSNLKRRYMACKNTWLKDFDNTFLFGGNGSDNSLINFIDAGEDYNSHFLKQQLGLKYMFEYNDSYDWYCITSCDAILFKNKTIEELNKYDFNSDLLLAEPAGFWSDDPYIHETNSTKSTFRSIAGGGGFFISNSLMRKSYTLIDEFTNIWKKMSGRAYPFSDVAIAYMMKKHFNINLTHVPFILSQPPSHYNGAIKGDQNSKYYVDYPIPIEECIKNPMSFHYIKPDEMIYIYEKYKK